jgi:large subunit ribosomal protein L5
VSAKATDDKPVTKAAKTPADKATKTTAKAPTAKAAPAKAAPAKADSKAAKADSKAVKAPTKAAPKAAPEAAEPKEEAMAGSAAASGRPAGEQPAGEPKAPKGKTAEAPTPRAPGEMHGLHLRYREEVAPALLKEFSYANTMEVPRLSKIVVNIGLGEVLTNAKALDAAVGDLTLITGQKPIVTRARKSIAQFKIRTGNTIGAKVTLRGQYMWDFLERLTRLALPRIRDFRGVPGKSFDGRGNYSLGLREQLAFPEIDYDKIDRLRGLEISIVTTARTDEESKRLLQLLGMPFAS